MTVKNQVAAVLREHKIIIKAEHLDDVVSAISTTSGFGVEFLPSVHYSSLVAAAEVAKTQHPEYFEGADKPAQHQPGEFDTAFAAFLAASGCTVETYKTLRPDARLSVWWRFKDAVKKEMEPPTPSEAERLAERPFQTLTSEQKMLVAGQARQKIDNPAVKAVDKTVLPESIRKLSPERKLEFYHNRQAGLAATNTYSKIKSSMSSLSPLLQLEASRSLAKLEQTIRKAGLELPK